jgi:plastocyanin
MKINILVLIITGVLITYLSSCNGPDLGDDFFNFQYNFNDTNTVFIEPDGSFSPDTLAVKEGALVTLYNYDTRVHNLISENDTSFHSGNLAQYESFSYSANKIGLLKYHCTLHSETAFLKVSP